MPSVAHIIRRRRSRKARQHQQNTARQLWTSVIVLIIALAILIPSGVVLGFAGYLYGRAIDYMPSPADTIYLDPIIGATELTDRNGDTVIYAIQDPLGNNRRWLNVEDLPSYVIDATLQMEDPDFLTVGNFDFFTTVTRLWLYILDQPQRRDVSLAANLTRATLKPYAAESGLDDPLLDIALTAEASRRYSPRRVLEWYLNTAYYGNDAYGIDAAAQVYFGKSAADITLDEAAMLATIPPAVRFNPLEDETAARGRQLQLLRDMLANGRISREQFDAVAGKFTPIRDDLAQVPYIAPDFAVYAREQAEDILNRLGYDGGRTMSRGGLRITTSLDLDLYYQAECVVRAHLAQLNAADAQQIVTQHNQPCVATRYLSDVFGINAEQLPNNGQLVIQDIRTGEVRALVGNATAHTYEAGVTLHPFVYLTGFLSGNYTPARMVLDVPQQFSGVVENSIYTPSNADGIYRGVINLRDAMVANLNTPVASVADREGMSNVISSAYFMGLNSLGDVNVFDLSLVERGGAVSVLDMTYAYSVFANMGTMQGVDTEPIGDGFRARDPVAILKIEDAEGNIIWEYDNELVELSKTPKLQREIAYLINHILSDAATRRQILNLDDDALNIGRPTGVVNGMTWDDSDSWTVGYTPQLSIGVHLGRDDEASMSLDAYGLQGAAPIWQALMRYTHDYYNHEAAGWARPQDIVDITVCEKSGLIPPQGSPCPRRNEIFLSRVVPDREDTYWRTVNINSDTRLLASATTPDYLIIEEVFFDPPAAARDWWISNNQPLAPSEYDTLTLPEQFRNALISFPTNFASVGGVVEVRGSINTDNLAAWQLRYGQGWNPTSWLDIGGSQMGFEQGQILGEWDTSGLSDLYTLQLSVEYQDGTRDVAAAQVTVDNTAPTITLSTSDDATTYRFPAQDRISVTADVDDNLTINRVEFYRNGILTVVDEAAPFTLDVPIEREGSERFTAIVYDDVGNQAQDEIQVEVIR